jgi:hypothetical protein
LHDAPFLPTPTGARREARGRDAHSIPHCELRDERRATRSLAFTPTNYAEEPNFFAPDCHTGNSVFIGNDNFFGIGTTIVHGLRVGSGNRINAGTALADSVEDGQLVFASARTKQVGLYRRNEDG